MSRGAGWVSTPLIAAATALGLAGLTGLVVWGDWLRGPLLTLAVTAVAVTVARLMLRSAALPTLVGAATAIVMGVLVFAPAAGSARRLPTLAALGDLVAMLAESVTYARETVAPALVPPSLALAIAAGLVAIFLTAEALAVGAGLAASSGLVLLAPWLPALAVQRSLSIPALAAALVCWLAVLALQRRGTTRAPASSPHEVVLRGGVAAGAIAAAVGIALVATPVVASLPWWGALPRIDAPASLQGPTRLDVNIDLRDTLTERPQADVLTYTSPRGRLDVLRMYALADFTGATWVPDPVDVDALPEAADLLWPEPAPGLAVGDLSPVTVTATALADAGAPIPAVPRTAPSGDGWRYDAERDTVMSTAPSGTLDRQYTVQAALAFHTDAALRGSQELIARGGDSAVDARYLALAETIDTDSIGALARDLTADAADRYEQALALQEYLRGPSFTYDLEAAPQGDDAVSVFLEQRQGYCVQFASTMVVMARTLGIPARLAIGFLGGSPLGGEDGGYVVVRADAHAWPELYFPGHGWVRFEPTPAQQTGNRPAYALPTSTPEPSPSVPAETPTASAVPSSSAQAPSAQATEPGGQGATTGAEGSPWIAALVAVGAVLAVAALALRARRRAGLDAEAAWARVRKAAGPRLGGSESLTPHEAAARIEAAVALEPGERDALRGLRDAVEDARYAPAGSAVTPEQLGRWLTALTPRLTAGRRADAAAGRTRA